MAAQLRCARCRDDAQPHAHPSQQALVWWKAPIPPLHALDPRLPIHSQITSQSFSLQNSPIAQDTSAHTHALALEAALGGPDHMASRVGTTAHPSLVAAQLLRVREAWPEVWARTGRVQMASSFLASLLTGQLVGMGEAEASATGLWVHANAQSGTQSHWDEGVMEIVGGSREEGRRIWTWLGDVDVSGGRRRIGSISQYLINRYHFDPGTSLSSLSFGMMLTTWCRNDCHAIHRGLALFVPLAMSLSFRCSVDLWPYGRNDGPGSQLRPYSPL